MATHRVTASVLRVRNNPSTDHPIKGRLPRGTEVQRLRDGGNGWSEVSAALVDGLLTGWVSNEHLEPLAVAPTPPPLPDPVWLATANGEVGVKEFAGADHNPRILAYHDATSLNAGSDEVAWCSSFVNWCMLQHGIAGTNSAAARSWATWGKALNEPRPGCVVVFRREDPNNPNAGHVAFFIERRGAFIDVLGGNQGNSVKIGSYRASDLIGYRWTKP